MEIICKRRIQLNLYEFYKERSTGDTLAKVIDRFTVNPSIRPQQVPDWITETTELDEYIACGAIVVIGERPAPSVQPTVEEPTPVQHASSQPVELTAEDQELLNTPLNQLIGQTAPARWPTMGKSQFPSLGSI